MAEATRWLVIARRVTRNRLALAILAAIAISSLHVAFLPLSVSYDGLTFLDLADVLGSDRFPRDWEASRPPLFPLYLKAWLACFGRSPRVLIAALALLGFAVALVLGLVARKLAGDSAAAIVVVLVSTFPTFICYQHTVLSEVGSAFFLCLFVLVFVVFPANGWVGALTLTAALGTSYYWRQPLVALAPIVAVLHGLRLWWRKRGVRSPTELAMVAAQVLVVAMLPVQFGRGWHRYVDTEGMAEVTLRQGLLRQALLPGNHEVLRGYAPEYLRAVDESAANGNFLSGLRSDWVVYFYERLFPAATGGDRVGSRLFFQCARENPGRYLGGVARTLALLAGARGAESRSAELQRRVLTEASVESRFESGPGRLAHRIRREFGAPAQDWPLMGLLRYVAPVFDRAILLGSILSAFGVVAAIGWRDMCLLAVCTLPLAYFLPFSFVLASIDRYGFPAHPLLLANLVLVPWLVKRRLPGRPKTPVASPGGLPAADNDLTGGSS